MSNKKEGALTQEKNKTLTFKDLLFTTHPSGGGVSAKALFSNGYGVSVLGGEGFKGDGVNTFEVSILKDGKIDHSLKNKIYMTMERVTRRMCYYQGLPSTTVKAVGTINMEPKWIDLVSVFVTQIETGIYEQKEYAIEQLNRMAKVCDEMRQMQKKGVNPLAAPDMLEALESAELEIVNHIADDVLRNTPVGYAEKKALKIQEENKALGLIGKAIKKAKTVK